MHIKDLNVKIEEIISDPHVKRTLTLFLGMYIALDLVILVWFFLTPYLISSSNRFLMGFALLAYEWGYLVSNCHQMPQRTLFFSGNPMPFCARDFGIYIGCLIGVIVPLIRKKIPKYLSSIWFCALLLMPLVIDGVSQTIFSMRESSNFLRLATGLSFGFGMVFFFAKRIIDQDPGGLYSKDVLYRVIAMTAVILILIFGGSYLVSLGRITMREAIDGTESNPTYVAYISARSLQTIRFDPYLKSYQDPLLQYIAKYPKRGHGLWAIYLGDMNFSGKRVYPVDDIGRLTLVKDRQ